MDSHPKLPGAPPTPHRTPGGDRNAYSLYWDHWDIPRGQSLFQHSHRSIPRAVRLSRVAAVSRSPWITTGIPPAAPGKDKTLSQPSATCFPASTQSLGIFGKEPKGQPWGIVPENPFVKSLGIHNGNNPWVIPGDTTPQRPHNDPYLGECSQLIPDFQRGLLIPEQAPGLGGVPQRHQPQLAQSAHLEKDGNKFPGEGIPAKAGI